MHSHPPFLQQVSKTPPTITPTCFSRKNFCVQNHKKMCDTMKRMLLNQCIPIEPIVNEIVEYSKNPKMDKIHQKNVSVSGKIMEMGVRYSMYSYNILHDTENDPVFFSDYLSSNVSLDEQIVTLQALRRCQCCKRHQIDKPEIITELEPPTPEPPTEQNTEEIVVQASSYIYDSKKEHPQTTNGRNKCECPCRHYSRWLYASILKTYYGGEEYEDYGEYEEQ